MLAANRLVSFDFQPICSVMTDHGPSATVYIFLSAHQMELIMYTGVNPIGIWAKSDP